MGEATRLDRRGVVRAAAALGVAGGVAGTLLTGRARAEPAQRPASVAGAPYPRSSLIKDVTFDFPNLYRTALGSDLWANTWAADGNIYASWSDGAGFGGHNDFEGIDGRVNLGFGRIEKTDPREFFGHLDHGGVNVWGGKNPENPATLEGYCPSMVSINGVLYAWIDTSDQVNDYERWTVQLYVSSDLSRTWQTTPMTWPKDIGGFAPRSFINFGQDYAGARDEYVYNYGIKWGSLHEPSTISQIYLARVPKNQLANRNAYEFFAGWIDRRRPNWTEEFESAQPVFDDARNGSDGNVLSVVYHPVLQRYILTITHLPRSAGRLGIFEASEPWGDPRIPWRTVAYYEDWGGYDSLQSRSGQVGSVPLLYHLPTKWMSSDGATMWMMFSSTGVLDSFNLVKATLTLR